VQIKGTLIRSNIYREIFISLQFRSQLFLCEPDVFNHFFWNYESAAC